MPLNFDDPSIVFHVKHATILEASAGSGKTTILTERWIATFLYLLIWEKKTVSESIHSIVALTFTKKAATEMKMRIRARIDELWSSDELELLLEQISFYVGPYHDSLDDTKSYLYRQKSSIDDFLSIAVISTINAFILQILRAYPLESGMDITIKPEETNYSSSNNEKEAQLIVLRKLIDHEYKDQKFITYFQTAVNLLGINKWLKLLQQLRELIFQYGDSAVIEGLDQSTYLLFQKDIASIMNDTDILFKLWDIIFPSIETLITALEAEKNYSKLSQNNEHFYCNLKNLDYSSLLIFFSKDLLGEYQLPKNPVLDEELNILRENSYYAYQCFIDTLYRIICPLMLPILELCSYEHKKLQNESGYISFGESERVLLELLKNNKFLHKIQSRIKFFFVDEYQDTSDLQKSIFDLIISEDSVVPFFVGDPKQSIYSFRKANVYVFDQTIQEFRKKKYAHKLLNINYRSSKSHVDLVNYIFSHIFSHDHTGIKYYDQIAKKDEDGQFYYTLALEKDNHENILVEEHLEHAFNDAFNILSTLLSNGVNPGEIMILFRKRDSILSFYELIKEKYPHLPVASSVKNILWNSPYITPIISFLRVLVNPHHDLTLIELLKTFLFRKTDDVIVELLFIAQESQKSLYDVLDDKKMIEEFFLLKDRILLEDLISLIMTEFNYKDIISEISHSGDLLATITLFIDEVRQLQEKGNITVGEFINYIDHKKNTIEEAEFAAEEGQTLRLMTIHSSKGLESPYVIYVHKCSNKEKPLKFPLYQNNSIALDLLGKGLIAENLRKKALEESVSEEKRLAYVTLTRAKYGFYFCSLPSLIKNTKSNKHFETQWASFLHRQLIEEHPIFFDCKFLSEEREVHFSKVLEPNMKEYDKHYCFLKAKDEKIKREVLPQFLSVSLLLDAEFNPARFNNYSMQHAFNPLQSLRELSNDYDFVLKGISKAEIGTLVHVLLQEFDSPSHEEVLAFLKNHYHDKIAIFDTVLAYAYNYWSSLFYQNIVKNSAYAEKEKIVFYLSDNDIVINCAADVYISSASSHTVIDYKLSLGNNLERYIRQLSYYALLLEKSKHSVDHLVLFSLTEAKEYYINWDKDMTQMYFDNAITKATALLLNNF